jgi:hypothetical protein
LASPSRGTGWLPAGPNKWTCLICRDSVPHPRAYLKRHLNTAAHKNAIQHIAYSHLSNTELPDNDGCQSTPLQAPRTSSPVFDISFDTEVLSTAIWIPVGARSRPIFVCQANDLRAGRSIIKYNRYFCRCMITADTCDARLTLFTQDEQEPGSLHSESEHESGNENVGWWHCDPGDVTHS